MFRNVYYILSQNCYFKNEDYILINIDKLFFKTVKLLIIGHL